MLETLKTVIHRQAPGDSYRECRHCGASTGPSAVRCPSCGSREIARYDV